MTAFAWFIAGVIAASLAFIFLLVALSDDDPPDEEEDAYDEGMDED